jgi:flagellar M-ring protein FliF
MLEKVVGPGHVDVRVTADVDPARVEHVEDHYDPAKTALRSEELTRERLGAGYDDTVAGVPGAESNAPSGPLALPTAAALPPPPPAAPSSAPAASGSASAAPAARPSLIASATPRGPEQPFRESHTRNFEVDHVSDKRSIRAGSLRRVGVAVILDGIVHAEGGKKTVVPRERAELDRLTALVRSAVGASAERGDSVTVESVPFEESAAVEAEVPVAPSPFAALPRPVRTWAPVAGGALLLVLLVGGVMLTRKRRGSLVREILPAVVAQALDLPRVETKQIESDLRTRALERAAQDPATAALVLRYWLGTSASESKGASSG